MTYISPFFSEADGQKIKAVSCFAKYNYQLWANLNALT